MKFTTKNVNINGTSLQGYMQANFHDLVEIFGEPEDGDGYKTDAEWHVKFEDGTIATIYNYKDGRNYCGMSGIGLDEITDWHIGGFERKALQYITEAHHNGFFEFLD
jgi:hypothetical protein